MRPESYFLMTFMMISELIPNRDKFNSFLIVAQWHHAISGNYVINGMVRVKACFLFGEKPWPEPMLSYCNFELHKHKSIKILVKI